MINAAPQGVVGSFSGSSPGPLPTGLLKPSKVLVTNSGDRASEANGENQNLRGLRVPLVHRMIRIFGDESATGPSGNEVQGGPRFVVEVPMTVQSAGRCSSNSSSGQLLLQ